MIKPNNNLILLHESLLKLVHRKEEIMFVDQYNYTGMLAKYINQYRTPFYVITSAATHTYNLQRPRGKEFRNERKWVFITFSMFVRST